jgi:hypothetical protein
MDRSFVGGMQKVSKYNQIRLLIYFCMHGQFACLEKFVMWYQVITYHWKNNRPTFAYTKIMIASHITKHGVFTAVAAVQNYNRLVVHSL